MHKTMDKKRDKHGKRKFEIPEDIASLWGETEPTESEFEDVPPDKYQVRIDSAEINKSKSSERLQVSYQMTIASGKYANRKVWKHDGIDNEQSIGYFKGSLKRLGLECPEDFDDLPELLEELVGTYAQVTVKQRGEYTNVYWNKALDDDEVDLEELEEEGDETEEDEDEDERPSKKKSKSKASSSDGDEDEDAEEEEDDDDEEEEKSSKKKPAKKGKKDDDEDEEEAESDGDEDAESDADEDEDAEDADSDADEDEEPKSKKPSKKKKARDEDEDEDEDAEDAEVIVKFTKVDSTTEKLISKLAKQHEFDEDEYEDPVALLTDIAEYLGVSGTYKKPAELIAACKKASA